MIQISQKKLPMQDTCTVHLFSKNCSNYTEYKIFPHPREITAAQRDQAVVMSEVNCTGSEMNLSLCSYELLREEDAAKCGHNEDVVLSCLPHGALAPYYISMVTPSTDATLF